MLSGCIMNRAYSRREVLSTLGGGFGGLVLASLLKADSRRVHDLQPKQPHFAPKARAVIQLFMHGGPSHVDLLDPKPMLDRYDGQAPPAEAADGSPAICSRVRFAFASTGSRGSNFPRYCRTSLGTRTRSRWCGRCSRSIAITSRLAG